MKHANTIAIVAALSVVFYIQGCGYLERSAASWTGAKIEDCVDGVMYIQATSGFSVKYNRNGTVQNCGK